MCTNYREPETHAGAFKRIEDIPQRYRLNIYYSKYEGKDLWTPFKNNTLLSGDVGDRKKRQVERAGEHWLDHMDKQDRHHALATPTDVNTWCEKLLKEYARYTVYQHFFNYIYRFYDFLKSHYQHPHLYNPCLLAAINHQPTKHVWMFRFKYRE